jgi:large subunit ribosomal protein L13
MECLIKIILWTLSYKTKSASKATVTKEWIVVDADGHNLGRLASKVAMILRGTNQVTHRTLTVGIT